MAADLAHLFGPGGVTVERLVSGVGSSRNTFYELFPNCRGCLRYAVKEATERLLAPVRGVDRQTEWALGVRDALGGFYEAVAAAPNLAELLLIRSFAISREAGENGLDGAPLASGHDPYLDAPVAFGIGFQTQTPELQLGPFGAAFGHGGSGGSMHGAWPAHRVGFSYAMNQLRDDRIDDRPRALLTALADCVERTHQLDGKES